MLKLLIGDKRKPTDELSLDSGDGISLMVEGSEFGTGRNTDVLYTGSQPGRHGAKRLKTTRNNSELSLTIRAGAKAARVSQLLRDLRRFDLACQEYEERDHGQPVYLGYRLNDGLTVAEPVFGQFSTFVRVLHINIESLAANLQTPSARPLAWDQSVIFTVAAEVEGLPQTAGLGSGALKVDPQWGLIVGEADTAYYNWFQNPSFGHATFATAWDINFLASGAAEGTQTIDARSYESAIRISHENSSAGSADLTQTVTLGAAINCFVSGYVKLPSGVVPSADNVQCIVNGSAATTYYLDNKDGWYRIWGQGTAAAGAAIYGFRVATGQSIIFDDCQLELDRSTTNLSAAYRVPRPFFNGDYLGARWWDGAGTTRHAEETRTDDGILTYALSDEMTGAVTISGWFTPTGNTHSSTTEAELFSYDQSTTEMVGVILSTDSGSTSFKLNLYGTEGAQMAAAASEEGSPFHIAIAKNPADNETRFYINGALVETTADDNGWLSSGELKIGYGGENDLRSGWAVDGFKIWAQTFTDAEIGQLYAIEKPVKDNGDLLGLLPFVWSDAGGGEILNRYTNDFTTSNGIVIGGVCGDLPAKLKLAYTGDGANFPLRTNGYLYIGTRSVPYRRHIHRDNLFWHAGAAVSVTTEGANERYAWTISSQDIDLIRGEQDLIIVCTNSPGAAGASYTYTPRASVSHNDRDNFGYRSHDSSAETTEFWVRLPNVYYDWPLGVTPDTAEISVLIAPALGSNWTVEELILLPRPFCSIIGEGLAAAAISTGATLVIEGETAWLENSSAELQSALHKGDVIEALPGRYNHLFHLGLEDDAHDATEVFVVSADITPCFTLLGRAG